MKKTHQDLLAEAKALDRQIAQAERREKAEAIRQVRELIEVFGFSMSEVGASSGRAAPKPRPKAVTQTHRPRRG